MYSYETTVRLHHTDSAGSMFFGSLFFLLHDAYEELMAAAGTPVGAILAEGEWVLSIVHAEADFILPVRVGTRVCVAISLARVGTSSFTLGYAVATADGRKVARGSTVHAAIEPATGTSRSLPKVLGEALQRALGVG